MHCAYIELAVEHEVKAQEVKIAKGMAQLVFHTVETSCHDGNKSPLPECKHTTMP